MSKQEKNERPINFEWKGILDIVLNGVLASSANDIPMQNLFVLNLSKKTNNSITWGSLVSLETIADLWKIHR